MNLVQKTKFFWNYLKNGWAAWHVRAWWYSPSLLILNIKHIISSNSVICTFVLLIKGFKKIFQNWESVLDFQSKLLLGIAEGYFPAMSEKRVWCKQLMWGKQVLTLPPETDALRFLMCGWGAHFQQLLGSAEGFANSGPHCFLPVSRCAFFSNCLK